MKAILKKFGDWFDKQVGTATVAWSVAALIMAAFAMTIIVIVAIVKLDRDVKNRLTETHQENTEDIIYQEVSEMRWWGFGKYKVDSIKAGKPILATEGVYTPVEVTISSRFKSVVLEGSATSRAGEVTEVHLCTHGN